MSPGQLRDDDASAGFAVSLNPTARYHSNQSPSSGLPPCVFRSQPGRIDANTLAAIQGVKCCRSRDPFVDIGVEATVRGKSLNPEIFGRDQFQKSKFCVRHFNSICHRKTKSHLVPVAWVLTYENSFFRNP